MPSVLKRPSVIFDSRVLSGYCRDRKGKVTGFTMTRILYATNDGLICDTDHVLIQPQPKSIALFM